MKETNLVAQRNKIHGQRTGCAIGCEQIDHMIDKAYEFKHLPGGMPREVSITTPCIQNPRDCCRVKIHKLMK